MYSRLSQEASLLAVDIDNAWQQLSASSAGSARMTAAAAAAGATSDDCGPRNSNNVDDDVGRTNNKDSSTATVIAMGTGYLTQDYERFVGSLRKTGYKGHIILAVSPDMDDVTRTYLDKMNVTLYAVQKMNCTFTILEEKEIDTDHDKEIQTCLYPYPTLKHRWARYALLRDLLVNCTDCTGPVLHTDLRDTIFQRDPFGPDAPSVTSLQVFEEHYTIRTTNWVSNWPVSECKGIRIDEPMLCSGTTVGTRTAMIEYLNIMHEEMDAWMASPKCCCFKTSADDQAIHNWLFYGTDLLRQRPPSKIINNTYVDLTQSQIQRQRRIRAIAIPNRQGIVNTVGAHASLIHANHMRIKRQYLPEDQQVDMHAMPFDGSGIGFNGQDPKPNEWLGLHHGLTDEDGYIVQNDGTRSFVIHQMDRFGPQYYDWISRNNILITRDDV